MNVGWGILVLCKTLNYLELFLKMEDTMTESRLETKFCLKFKVTKHTFRLNVGVSHQNYAVIRVVSSV